MNQASMHEPRRRRLLFVSNGHGEDALACQLVDRLARSGLPMEIEAWPMVGHGTAYDQRSVPIVGAPNHLPSDGFATLSAPMLWRDLRSGWVRTHLRQVAAARRLRGRYHLVIAVGDVVPMVAAILARSPFLFVGCAKSAYYGRQWGYTWLERRWLARHCLTAFPRDELTARDLARSGVPTRFVGNPMMDDLGGAGDDFGIPAGETCVTLLPGSRRDAIANARQVLRLVPTSADLGRDVTYLMPLADGLIVDLMSIVPPHDADRPTTGWTRAADLPRDTERSIAARLAREKGTNLLVVHGREAFADALRAAQLVIGMAGTANEQAVGLGKALLVLPASGGQGEHFVRMKMRFFGESAIRAPGDTRALASCMRELLDDPDRRGRMAAAGVERMGWPGASDAICSEILSRLGAEAPTRAAPLTGLGTA